MVATKSRKSEIINSQDQAMRIANQLRSPTLMMLVLTAFFGTFLYGSFLFNVNNHGDTLPYIMVLIAESFLLYQALLSLWTILASSYDPRSFGFHRAQQSIFRKSKDNTPLIYLNRKQVKVDVFITTYGEDIKIIRQTAKAARDIIGLHETFILDDGKSEAVKHLANKLGIKYLRRENNSGAKAGNINNALQQTKGNFFAIFDADFVPSPLFLYETIPFFENEKIAFVQTPQNYRNLNNLISKGAGYMQSVFYSLIQPGKNRFNAAFCVGTNVIFRRSAVEVMGGLYEESKSEDIWTSIILHEHGFKSIYIPNSLAIGATPETIESYSKQQLRWATGGFEIFFHHNPLFQKKLTIDQKIQYMGTSTYYFNGIASFLLLLLPPLQIFLNLTPVNLHISVFKWALYYSSFYVMQIVVAFYTMGGFRLETLMLANSSFPIYIKAFFNALFNKNQSWSVTGRVKAKDSPFNYIKIQVWFFVFLLGTSIVGIWKSEYTHQFSISIFWNTLNTFVLGSFIWAAFKENYRIRNQDNKSNRILEVATS